MPIGELLAQISGEERPPPTPSNNSQVSLKRKAEGDLSGSTEKALKRVQPDKTPSQPSHQARIPSTAERSLSKPKLDSRPAPIARSEPKQSSNGGHNANTNAPTVTKPPKKGSYAEILARGKAAQAKLGQVGKIQHKPIEKGLGKKERQELKGHKVQGRQEPDRHTGSGPRKVGRDVSSGSRELNGKPVKRQSAPPEEKKVKKAALATTGYSGTARPIMNQSKATRPTVQSRSKVPESRESTSRRYTYVSEEEDIEEDYYSDASSDMEAAAFEVDEEEEYALRVARHEDAEALKEENQHKREKEEKRRRLIEMARARR